jgi:hypothetical protein
MVMDHAIIGVSSSPDLDLYTEAKIKAQAGYKAIRKSATHPVDGFKFSTFTDITDALLKPLLDNGFPMPSFSPGYGPKGWVLVGKMLHKSGQWESCTLPLLSNSDEPGMQRLGADITEGKKILFKILAGGWEEGDEPEAAVEPEEVKEEPVNEMVIRAEKKLQEKKDSPKDIAKILKHLDILVEQGEVSPGQAKRLRDTYGQEATSA